MTTSAAVVAVAPSESAAPARAAFPDFPPRNDMMNPEHLHDYGHQPALRLHLGDPESTIVLGEVPIYWGVPIYGEAPQSREDQEGRENQGRGKVRVPDLLVAFHIRRAQVIEQKGYAINEQGKPPDFVLEVASDSTASADETDKWQDYARFGVTEYWLFDPDWGRRYRRGLMGWRLVDGRFAPIVIREYAPGMYYGWSAALGLFVCWEHGRLRWYDPAAGYLRSHDEERDGRIAAEVQRDVERGGRVVAEAGRIVAEAQRDAERDERIAAEAQRDAAAAERDAERDGRQAAEAEINRLRAEIERLRGDAAADDRASFQVVWMAPYLRQRWIPACAGMTTGS